VKSWVKTPVDLPRRDPALSAASPAVRCTFEGLYRVARRGSPLLGYLVGEDLEPLSVRELASLIVISYSTVRDHIEELEHTGLVQYDLARRRFLPLVIRIEQLFDPSPYDVPDELHVAGRSRRRTRPTTARTAVENGVESSTLPGLGWPGADQIRPPPAPPLRTLQRSADETKTKRSSLDQEPAEPWELEPLVPPEISYDPIRWTLAKLAAGDPVWRALLEKDRPLLKRVAGEFPASALFDALEQAVLQRKPIRNAGAWLTGRFYPKDLPQEGELSA